MDLAAKPFSVRAAMADGVSEMRLRHSALAIPTNGVRNLTTNDVDVVELARAIQSVCPDAVISYHTAARVWGLPLWSSPDADAVHLTQPPSKSRRVSIRRRNVRSYLGSFADDDVVRTRSGLLVTSPARTFLDLSAVLAVDELIALADAAVCEHPGRPGSTPHLVALDRLRARVLGAAGRRGVRKARAVLNEVRVGSDSPQETQLRLDLVRAGLPEPELNVVVVTPPGERDVWPDLAYVDRRLSVQYDGGHHGDLKQYRSDILRADLTNRAGWTEVRIGANDMRAKRSHPELGLCSLAVVKVFDAFNKTIPGG